ncbi:MAG: hypothetical protein QOC65_57 [Sphingomonadales bacterium]|nr:hypothetical protein [Sphingomonadales bacterium]
MRTAFLLAGLAFGAAAAASPAELEEAPEPLSYRCGDLVVVGRVETLAYEDVEIENDLIGHGWFTARVAVRRVLAGRRRGRTLTVEYFAHAPFRHDSDFVLVIDRGRGRRNVIRGGDVIEDRRMPRLVRTCP